MDKHNYYQDYIDGKISLTEGYSKVTELVISLYEYLESDNQSVDEYLLNLQIEPDDHIELREFYDDQHDLFAHRIAHNFMIANDYSCNDDGIYLAKQHTTND